MSLLLHILTFLLSVFSVKRTTKVMTKARTNFEKAQYKDKENIRTIDVDVDDIESSVDLHH